MNFAGLPIGELIRKDGFDCPCGKRHAVDMDYMDISPGALSRLPKALEMLAVKKPFLVSDKNTHAVAGEAVEEILRGQGVDFVSFIYPQADVIEPDERPVGQVCMAFEPSCDYIIAIGSGVINDICKVLAKATGRDYIEVCTAPSMDGLLSNSSSMVSNGVKTTVYTVTPKALIADIDIIKNAPDLMLQSGLGDMVAKYVSVFEWKLSNIVADEYYCPEVAALMRNAADKCVEAAQGFGKREEAAVQTVTEGLVLSGLAMSFAQVSRPASGLEHYFSHMFDMFTLDRGTPGSRHGVQVGIGTVLTLRLYDMIKSDGLRLDIEMAHKAIDTFDAAVWQADMLRIFGKAGEAVIDLEQEHKKNDRKKHYARVEKTLQNWPAIMEMIRRDLPSSESVVDILNQVGAPILPADIGIDKQLVREAFIGSREIRDKYILTNLFWDFGLMDDMCERLIAGL